MQRAEFDSNPAAFRTSYAGKQKELTDKIVAARALLKDVSASCFSMPSAVSWSAISLPDPTRSTVKRLGLGLRFVVGSGFVELLPAVLHRKAAFRTCR
jgi:hypothetical protein